MRAVLQRVTAARVRVAAPEGLRVAGEIGPGLVALVGVETGDDEDDARWLAAKIAGLRLFADAGGKMNQPVAAAGGAVLAISQFTLLADARHGRRPSFARAARPEAARSLFDQVVAALRGHGCAVATGVFGAHMALDLTNDGPVTICLDSPRAAAGAAPSPAPARPRRRPG